MAKRKSPTPPEPLQVINIGDVSGLLGGKRPPHRAPSPIEFFNSNLRPAMRVLELERDGATREAAKAQVMAELGCKRRKVENSLACLADALASPTKEVKPSHVRQKEKRQARKGGR